MNKINPNLVEMVFGHSSSRITVCPIDPSSIYYDSYCQNRYFL